MGVFCPTCTQLTRDEELLRSAVEEVEELLRSRLPDDIRAQVEQQEAMLATSRGVTDPSMTI